MEALRPGDPGSVGPYQLVGRLGSGGMGQVYLAETPGGRQVAVKLINPGHARNAQFRERFAREVEAARRVGGFHTAQVVDADPQADPPWMVTAYIAGPSLEEAVDSGGPLPPDEVRALGAALAEGLAAIHRCGLVHRDLKPGNVILGADGPRIIDFGIARAADQARLTAAGSVIGTLAYMSPEQFGGLSPEQLSGQEAGPASDVFSLGGVLAFAATARPPFGDDLAATIIHRILTQPPDLAGLADEQLRQLIADCLAKVPADRPALTDILATLRADRTRTKRQPVIQVSQGLTLFARNSVGAVAFSPDGRLLAGPGDYEPGKKTRKASRNGKLWLWDLGTGEVRRTLTGFRAAAFSPDGRLLASGSESAQVQLWDPASGAHRRTVYCTYASPVAGVAFSPDGRLLAGSTHEGVWLWDPASGEHQRTLTGRGGEFFWGVAFSPDGRLLAGASSDGTVWLWDPANGKHQRSLTGHESDGYRSDVYGMAFSPDGRLLASAGTDKTVRLWDPAAGGTVAILTGHTGVVSSVAFSPDGRLLASAGSTDGTVRLWDPGTRAAMAILTGHAGVVSSVAFSRDGRLLASASGDKTVRLWLLTQAGR
jgi:serine/threonine protein kinase/sugar lactone lactonase YvrE